MNARKFQTEFTARCHVTQGVSGMGAGIMPNHWLVSPSQISSLL